jgi:excisionase family DNA binding protein
VSRPTAPAERVPPDPDRLAFSAVQVAKITGLSRSRVYELAASGELRALRAGHRILFDAESVRTWFAGLPEYEAS